MKISIIVGRYGLSGVPVAQLRLARAFSEYGFEVDYLIGHVNKDNIIPNIRNINIHILNKLRVSKMLIPLITYMKSEKPDIIFSAGDHLNIIVLMAAIISKSRAKISVSSRVTPFDEYSNIFLSKGWILKQFMKAVSWRADAMTCVSTGMIDEYKKVFGYSNHKCVYNIIGNNEIDLKKIETIDNKWFLNKDYSILVAAGMLESWKGYEDLIYAIKELTKVKKIRLLILGDGTQKFKLQSVINELELSETIKLEGYVENPLKYFSQADIFVHASHVESFGNVLIEAMMCGCTVVSTDCPTGPREILQNGRYGYLVPMNDTIAMAKTIEKAIDSPISKILLNEAIQPFSEKKVIKKHFEVLNIDEKVKGLDL